MKVAPTASRPSMALMLHGIEKVRFFKASQISMLIYSPIHGFDLSQRGQHV